MKADENFFSSVYEIVKLIPKGRVTSYGAIAKYLGLRSGARMVGWAMNAVGPLKHIPAHRVVNSAGLLTGKHHFSTSTEMQELLEQDGIEVHEDQVKNFSAVLWDPVKELL